jgi:hypothetical protein
MRQVPLYIPNPFYACQCEMRKKMNTLSFRWCTCGILIFDSIPLHVLQWLNNFLYFGLRKSYWWRYRLEVNLNRRWFELNFPFICCTEELRW